MQGYSALLCDEVRQRLPGRPRRYLRPRREAEPPQDVLDVQIRGALRNDERFRDFAIPVALRDERRHFLFAWRKR